jgi:hypothetical protein
VGSPSSPPLSPGVGINVTRVLQGVSAAKWPTTMSSSPSSSFGRSSSADPVTSWGLLPVSLATELRKRRCGTSGAPFADEMMPTRSTFDFWMRSIVPSGSQGRSAQPESINNATTKFAFIYTPVIGLLPVVRFANPASFVAL